jgi:hypothetical protein
MASRFLALFLLAGVGPLAPHTGPATGSHPLEQLAWMVGGTWTAVTTLPSGDRATIEATFEWTSHKRAIRYSVVRKAAGRVMPALEGMCVWHPGRKQLALWEIDADGNLTESTLRAEGRTLSYDEVIHPADGSSFPVRAEAIRESDDRFSFKAFVEKDGRWPVVFQADYKRVRP